MRDSEGLLWRGYKGIRIPLSLGRVGRQAYEEASGKINVNGKNTNGATPLMLAVKNDQLNAVKYLLEQEETNAHIKSDEGKNALDLVLEKPGRGRRLVSPEESEKQKNRAEIIRLLEQQHVRPCDGPQCFKMTTHELPIQYHKGQ